MSLRPLRVRFILDGSGVMYDLAEPTHLDALLAFCCAAHHVHGEAPGRNDTPADIPLPLQRWHIGGTWGWCASALFPVGPTAESVQHWRKRFRQSRVQMTSGSPNLTMATWRDWNMPMPLLLCHEMEAFCVGDRRVIRHELVRGIRHLGKKRSMGKGVVNDVIVEHVEEDFSMLRDGCAMRWLPDPDGSRLCRPRPPYWNNVGRVPMCEVGDAYALESGTMAARR